VFHSGYEDLLLQPVNASDRSEAVHAIMEQYIRKIVLYHKFIKRTLQKIERSHVRSDKRTEVKKAQKVINSLSNLVKIAKGEMLHGLTLCDLYSEELHELHDFFKARLSTAMDSFDVLAEEIERINVTKILSYLFELTEDSGKLTKLITLLTFIMVILVIFQIFQIFSLAYD
jgi:flagellin-specific chaperone FliS